MNAGAFLRQQLVRTAMYGTAVDGIVIGLGIGMAFYAVFPQWIGFGWGVVAYGAAFAALLITPWVMGKLGWVWDLDSLAKGVDAETGVGQVIERAITAESCAVAHSVTKIAKVGDIDHIVVTPKAVWVIETKYRWVPKPFFPGVLSRIAANTSAVREWLPPGTQVRGCLVLFVFFGAPGKPKFKAGGEEITVYYGTKSLSKEMSKETGKAPPPDPIVKKIWEL